MTKAIKLIRRPNGELRTREYLTGAEVERLIKAAKSNRYGQRDATMILLTYRHGLRAAEVVDLRWDQVDLGRNAALHVRRVKQGLPSVHPLQGDEMRALRELKRSSGSPFVFTSERGAPFTTAGFAKLIERAGVAAKLGFKAHPHMLRHACGYALANAGHDTRALQAYLGHKNIQHTVRYTELSPAQLLALTTEKSGMWIFAKDGFLSITPHREKPDMLIVRARVKGDIEHYFPGATVICTDDADYLYRTTLPREEVADRVREAVIEIRSGLKDSVTDKRRAGYYLDVWSTMAEMQDRLKA